MAVHEQNIWRVWEAVRYAPHATRRELAGSVCLSTSTVNLALETLRDRGLIDYAPQTARTITIKAATCHSQVYRVLWLDL